ncbi:MAG TPA: sensor histidine kinase, partial [Spirochaetales bacterium]|nr:sensor histidine kinase [Spirochaetales bacterium]
LEKAIPCGLVVNELVTNALKHAFPSGRQGSIRVGIRRERDGVLELEVADDGVGMSGASGREGGIGRHLVASLVAQLGGVETVSSNGGVTVRVRFA